MTPSPQFNDTYNICVIDIGSPKPNNDSKYGNIGWCVIDADSEKPHKHNDLDRVFKHIKEMVQNKGLILGLEAPLIIPVREELEQLTGKRKCDGKTPWSSGPGGTVLTMNLAVMPYLFNRIKSAVPDVSFYLNEDGFEAKPKQIMLFEAFVSGEDKDRQPNKKDKPLEHINDAKKMAKTCLHYAKQHQLPPSEHGSNTGWLNLAAVALLRCGLGRDIDTLSVHTPIYKPMPKGS